jgi:hypothetical protein
VSQTQRNYLIIYPPREFIYRMAFQCGHRAHHLYLSQLHPSHLTSIDLTFLSFTRAGKRDEVTKKWEMKEGVGFHGKPRRSLAQW